MASKLLRPRHTNLISPLIDVVLGAFLALFVFFSAFVILSRHPDPLSFLEVALPPCIAGQSYTFTFPVTGGEGKRHFELLGELPGDLMFETESGTIFGFVQPSDGWTVRDLVFTVVVEDSIGSATRDATLRIFSGAVPYGAEDARFRLASPAGPLAPGRIGRTYEALFAALRGVEPYRWSFDGLPRGLNLEGGVLSGVPAETGSFVGTVRVSHSPGTFRFRDALYEWAGGSASASVQLQVYGPLRLTERFPPGRMDEPYLGALVANGLLPDEEVEWSGLPSGLEVSEDGLVLLGVPAEAGTFSLDYRVRTPDEELVAGNVEIVILESVEPALGPATLQAWLGEPTRQLLPVRGLCGPLRFAVEGELPSGLEIHDGYLTGTVQQGGLTTVQVTATDGAGTSVTGSITIRVGPRY
jgi:hypothetical protein